MRQSIVQNLLAKSSLPILDPGKFKEAISHDFISGFQDTCVAFEEICSKSAHILNANRCLVFIFHEKKQILNTLIKNLDGKELQISKPVDKGITGFVFSEQAVISSTDPLSSPQWSDCIDDIPGITTKSYLACPLWDSESGSCIGVVEFRNKLGIGNAGFDPADEQMAQIIAFQISRAVVHNRQQSILEGRNRAINLVYEEKYDLNDAINIEDETDSKSSKPTSLQSLNSTERKSKYTSHNSVNLSTAWKWKPPPIHDNLSERDWSYDVFSKSEEELIMHAVDVFDERGLFSNFSIPVTTFVNFVKEIKQGYNSIAPYHNHYHAFDVMHVCYMLITRCKADEFLDSFNTLSLLIGALAHDLGHDGFNNSFHCSTNSELAVMYNGISVLENYSAAYLFRILRKENCNIFARLSETESNKLRSRLIDMILDTDAKNHFTLMTQFKLALETKQLSRGLLSSMLLHVSDVSNPTRPGVIARKWAFAVQEEFFRQGDKEKELNAPISPFMDREYENLPRMQITFIDAVVKPVFKLVEELLPSINTNCVKQLQINRSFWNNMQTQSITTTNAISAYVKGINDIVEEPNSKVESSTGPPHEVLLGDSKAPIPGIPPNVNDNHATSKPKKMSLIPISGSEVIDFSILEQGEWTQNDNVPIKLKKTLLSQCFALSSDYRSNLTRLLDSSACQAILLIATVYSLFANDLNLIVGNKKSDPYIDIMTFTVFLLFCTEILISLICVRKYMHFFFWLDLAAVISLVFEIGFLLPSEDSSPDALGLARASRAAKVGARAGRLAKLFRLVRLIKVAKLLKWAVGWRTAKDDSKQKDINSSDEDIDMKMSVVGRKMTESITKKVILTVMLMLIVFSLLETDSIPDGRQLQIDAMALNPESDILRESFFLAHNNILSLFGVGENFRDKARIERLRNIEIITLFSSINDTIYASFDVSRDLHATALFSIITTISVCCLLAFLSLLFSRDAYQIMIRPIEKMKFTIQKVKYYLFSTHESNLFLILTLELNIYQLSENPLLMLEFQDAPKNRMKPSESNETNLLERAITKMGNLLQVGFGSAGAEIIAKSMRADGELEPMVPGTRVHAIFGFCNIHNFTTAAEYLQEDVILFVNKLAKITHDHVVDSGGHPNKNIGAGFLLVWKLNTKDGKRDRLEKHLFDSALSCIQNIISDIKEIGPISEFSRNVSNRNLCPNSKIEMGFGLHSGWAIEGSIGSKVKVDASYLSLHVTLASRLESATKHYNVPLLMSHAFVSGLTGSLQSTCRRADRVVVSDSNESFTIFHHDMEPLQSLQKKPKDYSNLILATSWKSKEEVIGEGINITEIIKSLQSDKTLLIREVYDAAFNLYIDGNWKKCKILLHLWLEKFPGDVLVQNLIRYLMRHDFICPDEWNGSEL
jgi:class 3 adenylate cyclase